MLQTTPPYPVYTDSDGKPLDAGYIYIGEKNKNPATNPVSVYWDAAGTIPAAQPIRTLNGYASRNGTPSKLYVNSDCSVSIYDSKRNLVFTALDSGSLDLVNYVTTSVLASFALSTGATLIGWIRAAAGAVQRLLSDKLSESVSILDFGADPTGATDSTAAVNNAIATRKRVYAPSGIYLIDPDVGIKLKPGTVLFGDGLMRTVFKAMAKGATLAELSTYTKGSIIKRDAFTMGVANQYCTGIYLADFSVLLVHPAYNVNNYRQIGVDFRNITRSVVERVSSGNITIPGSIIDVDPGNPNYLQGYGFVAGTRGSSDIEYCGGEVNTFRDCFAWGNFKNLVVDDAQVCGATSAAHATLVDNLDTQAGHELVTQASQYNAGTIFKNLVIQQTLRQPGNVSSTVGALISGYGCQLHVKYAEMGTVCDVLAGLGSTSKDCSVDLAYYSYTSPSIGQLYDGGVSNIWRYQDPVNLGGGVFQNAGFYREKFAGGYRTVRSKFRWNGAAMEQAEGYGVLNIVRNNPGDYTVNLEKSMPTVNWFPSFSCDPDASGHLTGYALAEPSQSKTSVRVFFYTQVAGVTTPVDPRWVFFFGSQQ